MEMRNQMTSDEQSNEGVRPDPAYTLSAYLMEVLWGRFIDPTKARHEMIAAVKEGLGVLDSIAKAEKQRESKAAKATGGSVMGLSFRAADSVGLQALGGIQAQQPASVPCVSIIDEILSDLAQVKTTLDDFQAGQYPKAVDDLLKLVAHIVVDIVLPLVKAGNKEWGRRYE
jgi:hypothetical protein